MRRDELRLPLPPNNDRPGDRWMCGRRRRALLIATLILLGILLFMMRSPHQLAIIKPGNLSNPHAQILAGTITSQRCAACHPTGNRPGQDMVQWLK